MLAAYLLVLGFDPESVALSPFGPSQAGRFYGVSNLLETMLLVPAVLLQVGLRDATDSLATRQDVTPMALAHQALILDSQSSAKDRAMRQAVRELQL